MKNTNESYLKLKSFAGQLGVSEGTVRRWITQKRINVVRIGPESIGTDDRDHRPIRIRVNELQKVSESIPAVTLSDIKKTIEKY